MDEEQLSQQDQDQRELKANVVDSYVEDSIVVANRADAAERLSFANRKINAEKSRNDMEGASSEPKGNGATKLRKQFIRMSEALCDMLTDMGLVSFLPMNIQDAQVSETYSKCCNRIFYNIQIDSAQTNHPTFLKMRLYFRFHRL